MRTFFTSVGFDLDDEEDRAEEPMARLDALEEQQVGEAFRLSDSIADDSVR